MAMPLLLTHIRPRAAQVSDVRLGGGEDWLQALLPMRTSRIHGAIAIALIALACGTTLWLGVPHAAIYGHDTIIILDGGWRVLNGQRPHVDFYSAFGPVPYLIAAAGLKLGGVRVEGLVYSTAAVGALMGLWAWALLRRRMRGWSALLALAFVVLFWLAPFPYGEPFYLTGYAMQYNRLGYVLTALVLLELFTHREGLRRQTNVDWGGLSTGIAVGLLCFLKISFFFVACGLIAGAYLLKRKQWTHLVAAVAGFALVTVPMLAYLHWDLAAMLRDLALAAAARQTRFLQGYDPFRTVFRNLGAVLGLLGLAFLARRSGRQGVFGLASVAIAADLLLAMSNTQRQGFPLSLVATLILADRMCGGVSAVNRKGRQGGAAIAALLAVLSMMPVLADTFNSWGIVLRSNVLHASGSHPAGFDAQPLAGLTMEAHDEPGVDPAAHNGALYVASINDGLELLRRASAPEDRIASLAFANPFSYALLRPPPEGGSAFYASGVNITATHAPSAARILGNADVVMYPKDSHDDPEVGTLLDIVKPNLLRDYNIAAESAHWSLWRKKTWRRNESH
jgi:hypothetical protein